MSLSFAYPWALAASVLALLPLLFHRVRRFPHPGLAYFPRDRPSELLHWGLRLTVTVALILLVAASAGPYVSGGKVMHAGSGAQIAVVFDRSGSMSEMLTESFDESGKTESKIAAARRLLLQFMGQRKGDMFGVVAFGSSPIGVAPLGEDRQIAEAALASAQARSMGFTTAARALAMALDYFRDRPYTASRLVLLVSDGGAEISKADGELLQNLFHERGASLIWIYTRGAREPSVLDDKARSSSSQSYSMHQYFMGLGVPYQVFEATSTPDLQRAIDEVGKLTNLPTQYEEQLPRRDLAGPLFSIALLLMLLLIAAKNFEVRRWVA